MVEAALKAKELLKDEGINAGVINIHTLKPIDKDLIIKAAKETGAVVTAEEHSIIGGLGSAVSAVLCEEYPVPVIKVGIKDTFGESGKPAELLEKYGLTAKDIVEKRGLVQISDEGAIKEICQKVVDANPQSIADYKAGKDRAIGFLVGQIMKETKGKANPQIVNKLLLEIINK